MKLAIFGSCVSRDALDFVVEEDGIALVDYYARSSLASAFCSNPVEDRYSRHLTSTFQKRQVKRDFDKAFRKALPGMEFDILLMDFTDERFSLFRLEDGRLVTQSAELRQSKFPAPMAGRSIRAFTEEHYRLWEHGWRAFTAALAADGRLDRLRVNGALWADRTETGEGFGELHPASYIEGANRHFTRMLGRIRADLPEEQIHTYAPELLRGNASHKWGPAPFHYAEPYYRRTIAQLAAEAG